MAFRDMARDGVRYGAVQVALKAATATKIAPKRRRIVKNPKRQGNKFSTKNNRPGLYYAVKPQKGPDIYIPIWGTKESARQSKKAQITRRGLGQNAWKWMLTGINSGSRQAQMTNPMRWNVGSKHRYQAVTNRSTHPNPSIKLEDKLKYATLAFKVKGRATVFNIMQRAENAMAAQIRRRINGRSGSRSGLHSG